MTEAQIIAAQKADQIATSQDLPSAGHEPQIEEQPGLPSQKIWIYRVLNHKEKGFIKEQSLAILSLEPFTQVIAGRTNSIRGVAQKTIQNDSKGNTINFLNRLDELAYTTDTDITSANTNDDLLVATLKELKIVNGIPNTEVFLIDTKVPSLEVGIEAHGVEGLYNPTDFTMTSMLDYEDNYQSFKILYTFGTLVSNPTKLNLKFDNYTLLSKTMAKGKVAGKNNQDIDLEIDPNNSTKMSLITHTPTSTNIKLSTFSRWLDTNRTMAFIKAKIFLTSTSLKTLFDKTNADFKGWNDASILDAYRVVIGMLKLTNAYSTNFTQYRTAGDGKIDGDYKINGVKLVDFADKDAINAIDGMMESFKGKYPSLIDTSGFKVLQQAIMMLSNHINSNYAVAKGNNDFMKVYLPWYFVPQNAITFKPTANTKEDPCDENFEVLLKSEYFILNDSRHTEHRIEKIRYDGYDKPAGSARVDYPADKATALLIFQTGNPTYKNLNIISRTEVHSVKPQAVSGGDEHYDFKESSISYDVDVSNNNQLSIKPEFKDISGYIAHDLNGWISQPELPNKITPINKFATPGDISLKSDNDLKYLFLIPYDSEVVLENLYGELHKKQVSGWNPDGISRKFTQTFRISVPYGKSTTDFDSIWKAINTNNAQNLITPPPGYRVKAKSISNLKITTYRNEPYRRQVPNMFFVYYSEHAGLLSYTVTFDYEFEKNGDQVISTIQHKGTIFDKLNWRSVADNLTNGSKDFSLSLIPSHKSLLNIELIEEINIQAIWNDTLTIEITNDSDSMSFHDIQLPGIDDETLTNITLLF